MACVWQELAEGYRQRVESRPPMHLQVTTEEFPALQILQVRRVAPPLSFSLCMWVAVVTTEEGFPALQILQVGCLLSLYPPYIHPLNNVYQIHNHLPPLTSSLPPPPNHSSQQPPLPSPPLTPLYSPPPSQLINDFALALPERDRAAFMTNTEAARTVTEHYANGIPGM